MMPRRWHSFPHTCKRNDRGAIGGIEGLAFGILIFVCGTLVIVNAWGVLDTKLATSAAAREAARAYVESNPSLGNSSADDAATETMAQYNKQLKSLAIDEQNSGETYQRCAPITATVTAEVVRIPLPLVGDLGGSTIVTSKHTEVVDPYRSNLNGQAHC